MSDDPVTLPAESIPVPPAPDAATDLFGDALPKSPALLTPAAPRPPLPIHHPPIAICPAPRQVEILLTATTPISHHDPARQDESNTMLFLRRKQFIPGGQASPDLFSVQAALNRISAAHPVPATVLDLLRDLPAHEVVACLLVRLFVDLYGGGDGAGLFSGMERYAMLEPRLRSSAVRSASLRGCWNRLCESLQVPILGGREDAGLLSLFSLPMALQGAVLRALTTEFRSVTMLARYWSGEQKAQSEIYAEKAGRETSGEATPLALDAASSLSACSGSAVVEVPAVSSNTLRHQLVRGPGWRHLSAALSLRGGYAGEGEIPLGAEAIFANGGNIQAGSKQPGDPFGLGWEVRKAHPLLDLLGGVTSSFDLGESRLRVAGWLVCRENLAALRGTPAEDAAASVSAFDLLDDQVHTRQATEHGAGQMIYGFESLAPGTQVYTRLVLTPFTPDLTLGALAAALAQFGAEGGVVGGQSARGYGWMRAEILTTDPALAAAQKSYEEYLRTNETAIRQGMEEGTLGARQVVVR